MTPLATFRADPRVASAEPDGPARVLVTPDPAWLAAERARRRPALVLQVARRWQMAYDAAYHADGAARAPDFSTWTSSLTRAPIPEAAMRAWLDATVAGLRAGPHRRVLDLGCGTGLVLAALAPGCEAYVGLDSSEEAVAGLGAWLRERPGLGHVRLLHRPAHALDDLPEAGFDLVVLNSVAQYFPDLEHLLLVLRAAERCLAPGGRIWLGDLRAAALLPRHAAAVAAARLGPGAPAAERAALALDLRAAGRELALDPGVLPALAARLRRLPAVRFGLKPAATDPELAPFRFDAVLAFEPPAAPAAPLPWRAGTGTGTGPAALAARVRATGPLALLGVPNARLSPPENALEHPVEAALEPEALAAALAAEGLATQMRPTPGDADGGFDALLWPHAEPPPAWPPAPPPAVAGSDPLGAELSEALRASLQGVAEAAGGGVRVQVVAAVAGWPK